MNMDKHSDNNTMSVELQVQLDTHMRTNVLSI